VAFKGHVILSLWLVAAHVYAQLYIFQLNHWTKHSVSEILLDDLQNCVRKIYNGEPDTL